MNDDINDFENFWNGFNPALDVFDVPEATKKKLSNFDQVAVVDEAGAEEADI